MLTELADQTIAQRGRIVRRRIRVAGRTDDSRGGTLRAFERQTTVTVDGFGRRRVGDEGEQHEGQHARQRRVPSSCYCCGVTGHLIERCDRV